jgi:hypothetical protein
VKEETIIHRKKRNELKHISAVNFKKVPWEFAGLDTR